MRKKPGRLEIIRGCMFSGKTEELIRRLNRLKYARQTFLAFKHAIDNRYSETEIVSHNNISIKAFVVFDPREIFNIIEKHGSDIDVVAIDEAQFFDHSLVRAVQVLVSSGYRVIVAGLDTDFRGEPFGPMGSLLAVADEDAQLNAICTVCGLPANRTQRLIDGKPARWNDPIILVGAKDRYEARCRKHHEILG
ncbi:MAG: thymidine kinase [Thermosediminibacterales bacterium]|nr:thymidine kinase [Thermosediminibacterales bacterium]